MCDENKHIKSANLYCIDCNSTVCCKCLSPHKDHKVDDIDDVFEEILKISKEYTKQIQNDINSQSTKKENHQKEFKEKVQTHHDTQMEKIAKHFRDLHDSLHIKEVELKRELTSYYEENQLTYTTSLSKIEDQIQQSNDFITKYQDIIHSENPNTALSKITTTTTTATSTNNNNNNNDSSDSEKLKFIQSFNSTVKELEKEEETEYLKYIPILGNDINTMELIKGFDAKWPTLNRYVYKCFQDQEVEVIDTVNNQFEIIIDKGNNPQLVLPDIIENRLYQTVCNNLVYYFDKGKYYTIQLDAGNLVKWNQANCNPISDDHSLFSIIWDGVDKIYLFGGLSDITGKEIKTIYSFNIKTKTAEKLDVTLPFASKFHNLSIHKDYIYIIGGYNENDGYLNRIDRFNIKNNTIEEVVVFKEYILNGCFDHINGIFYMLTLTRPFKFIKYSLKKKKTVFLKDPPIVIPEADTIRLFKIYFDGNNTVLFFYPKFPAILYKYSIVNDVWEQKRIVKRNPENNH